MFRLSAYRYPISLVAFPLTIATWKLLLGVTDNVVEKAYTPATGARNIPCLLLYPEPWLTFTESNITGCIFVQWTRSAESAAMKTGVLAPQPAENNKVQVISIYDKYFDSVK